MSRYLVGGVAAVLSLSAICFEAFAFFIVPKWKDEFLGQGVDLPGAMLLLIFCSDLVVNYLFIIAPLTLGVFLFAFYTLIAEPTSDLDQ